MKTFNKSKKTILVIMAFIFMIPIMNAQSRYKHVPRVKVEKMKVELFASPQENSPQKGTTSEILIAEKKEAIMDLPTSNIDNIVASTNNDELTIVNKKRPIIIKHSSKPNIKSTFTSRGFSQHINAMSLLLHVTDVKKTALLGYLIWFIIVLIFVVALFVLAFVFLYMVFFTLHYIFLSLAIAAAVILALILILGLTGLI